MDGQTDGVTRLLDLLSPLATQVKNRKKYVVSRITWKHILLGFYGENYSKTRKINNFISVVCYDIYKYKMKCRNEESLFQKLKHNILTQKKMLKHIKISNYTLMLF